jgi:hypothetical protein
MVLSVSVASANTIISGDLKIRDGGDLVFSDGSVQSKAQVQGPKGDIGPAGGPPNTLTIGTVLTGNPGTAASAAITGTAPNQVLNLMLPQGPPTTCTPLTMLSLCAVISESNYGLPSFCYGTMGTVSGKVQTLGGAGFRGALVKLKQSGQSDIGIYTNVDGSFAFNGLKNDNYTLYCSYNAHLISPQQYNLTLNNNNSINNTFTVINSAPIANAGNSINTVVGIEVNINGSNSTDSDGDKLTYNWAITSKPTGSQVAINNINDSNARLVPDMAGVYVISLIVHDGILYSNPYYVEVTAIQATNVGGIISSDTVWTKASSPYIITHAVQIAYGAKLTIEPGVSIYCAQSALSDSTGSISVFGLLEAIGTKLEKIIFNRVAIIGKISAVSKSYSINIGYAIINGGNVHNVSSYGSFSMRDSVIIGTQGVALEYLATDCYIERNIFMRSGGLNVRTESANVYIINNVFYQTESLWAIGLTESSDNKHAIINNNTFMLTDRIAISLSNYCIFTTVLASNNYWSTTDVNIINFMINDKNDNLSLCGYVVYQPILTSPHPDTPDPTPYLK